MELPKYKNKSIWVGYDTFQKASDEQVAEWLEWAKATDAENKKVYFEYAKLYKSIMDSIETLYGKDSKPYKYMDKTSIDTQYYYGHFVRIWEDYNRSRKELNQKKERENRDKERAGKLAEKERKAMFAAWEIASRYNIKVSSDVDANEVLHELINTNRYLDLADAMMKTRNDWTDGFDRVQYALQRFMRSSDNSVLDMAIIADISECLNGDHDDGRVFRDTEWSYDKLFGLVDPQLAKDYDTLAELSIDEY